GSGARWRMIWPLSEGGRGLAESMRFGAAGAAFGTAITAASIVPASRRSKRTENIGSTPRNAFTNSKHAAGRLPIACRVRQLPPELTTGACFAKPLLPARNHLLLIKANGAAGD